MRPIHQTLLSVLGVFLALLMYVQAQAEPRIVQVKSSTAPASIPVSC
jgi:hypothetical protein